MSDHYPPGDPTPSQQNEIAARWEALRAAKRAKAIGSNTPDPGLNSAEMDRILAPIGGLKPKGVTFAEHARKRLTPTATPEKPMELTSLAKKLLAAAKDLEANGKPVTANAAAVACGIPHGSVSNAHKQLREAGLWIWPVSKGGSAKTPRAPLNGHTKPVVVPRPEMTRTIVDVPIQRTFCVEETPVLSRGVGLDPIPVNYDRELNLLERELRAVQRIFEEIRALEPGSQRRVMAFVARC